jgi:hypothetical protein
MRSLSHESEMEFKDAFTLDMNRRFMAFTAVCLLPTVLHYPCKEWVNLRNSSFCNFMAPLSPLSSKARGGGRWERKHYLPNFSEFVADTNESATTRYKHLSFACM